jgi:hypothetical protein
VGGWRCGGGGRELHIGALQGPKMVNPRETNTGVFRAGVRMVGGGIRGEGGRRTKKRALILRNPCNLARGGSCGGARAGGGGQEGKGIKSF